MRLPFAIQHHSFQCPCSARARSGHHALPTSYHRSAQTSSKLHAEFVRLDSAGRATKGFVNYRWDLRDDRSKRSASRG
jgi:hypothetical protein